MVTLSVPFFFFFFNPNVHHTRQRRLFSGNLPAIFKNYNGFLFSPFFAFLVVSSLYLNHDNFPRRSSCGQFSGFAFNNDFKTWMLFVFIFLSEFSNRLSSFVLYFT